MRAARAALRAGRDGSNRRSKQAGPAEACLYLWSLPSRDAPPPAGRASSPRHAASVRNSEVPPFLRSSVVKAVDKHQRTTIRNE